MHMKMHIEGIRPQGLLRSLQTWQQPRFDLFRFVLGEFIHPMPNNIRRLTQLLFFRCFCLALKQVERDQEECEEKLYSHPIEYIELFHSEMSSKNIRVKSMQIAR